jgi:predicted O-methyltransferase YrrM
LVVAARNARWRFGLTFWFWAQLSSSSGVNSSISLKSDIRRYAQKFGTSVHLYGLLSAVRLESGPAMRVLLRSKLTRRMGSPTVSDFLNASKQVSTDVESILIDLFPGALDAPFQEWMNEYFAAMPVASMRDSMSQSPLPYPGAWAVDRETALLLFLLVRVQRPNLVVETGVANGISSSAILLALEMNGHGRLVSIDIRDDVGSLIPTDLRGRWELRILSNGGSRRAAFIELLKSLDPIDLFLHDSEHTYGWQSLEFATALAQITPSGLIMSDDIDANFAFLDFCTTNRLTSAYLLGRRKIFGIARKSISTS